MATVTKKKVEVEQKTDAIVRRHVMVSMGIGLVPLPLLDVAAITATQLNLIRKLADHYEISFSKDLGKSIIASLIGGLGAQSMGTGMLASFIKAIPVVGSVLGAVTYPAIAGATTYAIGNVFIQHFESGGTLLDFDAEKMREYFAAEFRKGKEVAADIQKSNN